MFQSRRRGGSTMKSPGKNKNKSKRAPSKWNLFVKKIFQEMKRKNRDAKFKDALVEASNRKNEMKK
jgi:hypothetical protein